MSVSGWHSTWSRKYRAMRFFPISRPRILLGLLTSLFLVLGWLLAARYTLWVHSGDTPSSPLSSITHPSPPVLPGVMPPPSIDKASTPRSQPTETLTPKKKGANGLETMPSSLMEPAQQKVRVLPPIQAEPDEEEVVEFAFDVEPEPMADETPEEEPLPPMPSEQSPDFVH